MLLLCFFVATLAFDIGFGCPLQCRCSLDGRGRRRVYCDKGGMSDPIPVTKMAAETEVLLITAPESRPNSFSFGPIFRGLRQLEEIHITWSEIPALGDHSLWGLRRLHVLNLTRNQIEFLRITNFRGVESLRRLDLSHNHIESIPSAVFRRMQHLKSLTLAHNRIPELAPRIFFGLTRLEKLDLSYNPLGVLIPDRFSDISAVKFFSCAGCGLMAVSPKFLENLPRLHILNLSNNRMTQVPNKISVLKQISTLRLNGNHISFIEENFLSGSSLKKIILSHNKIIRIESQAFVNTSLSHLDLSYNRIPHLEPGALDDVLPQLTDLRLSGNSLYVDELKGILPNARNLRHLGLGDMGLTLLPRDLFQKTKHLHHLNISANYLQQIPLEVIKSAPHLRVLDLSMNSFRGMKNELIAYLTNVRELRVLKLDGNPWHCDKCHVGSMLKWLQAAPDQESGCSEPRVWTCLKCVGPKGFSGTSLALLPDGDLPDCYFSTEVKPTWMRPTMSGAVRVIPDEEPRIHKPRLPHGPLTLQEQEWTLETLLEEQFVLVVVVSCAIILSIFILIILAIIVYHRHSAYYYTHENDSEKNEKLVKSNHKNGLPQPETPPTNGKDATIATIDELTNIAGSQEILESKDDNSVLDPQDESNLVNQ